MNMRINRDINAVGSELVQYAHFLKGKTPVTAEQQLAIRQRVSELIPMISGLSTQAMRMGQSHIFSEALQDLKSLSLEVVKLSRQPLKDLAPLPSVHGEEMKMEKEYRQTQMQRGVNSSPKIEKEMAKIFKSLDNTNKQLDSILNAGQKISPEVKAGVENKLRDLDAQAKNLESRLEKRPEDHQLLSQAQNLRAFASSIRMHPLMQ